MSGRRTQLDTLLRVRRIEEDRAKAALAQANRAQRAAAELLAARQHAYLQAAAGAHQLTEASTDFLATQRHLTAIAGSIRGAEDGLNVATDTSNDKRAEVATASMRTQGLERLVERAAQAHEAKVLAADQRTAEESRAGKLSRGRS